MIKLVKCIDNHNVERSLSKGQRYKVLKEEIPDIDCPLDIFYYVETNFGDERRFMAHRFKSILEVLK